VKLTHFGYPPLMRQMYADAGRQTVKLFEGLKRRGLMTSLDMALPDPESPAGKAPWRDILLATLPHVDIFTPSLDEIVYMLDPAAGLEARKKSAAGVPLCGLSKDDIRNVVRELLKMGCGTVLLKLGKDGAYAVKQNEEYALPCFKETVFGGATGAGDSAIAGFLCGLTRGMPLLEALRLAVATGAASVEKPDATSGIPHRQTLLGRIRDGWPLLPSHFSG
jgi:sugar/nucleoside kinase (ribokinase family)